MRKLSLLILVLLLSVVSYAQENVRFSTEDKGTITLNVTTYGKNAETAIENAKILAVKTILFSGMANSRFAKSPLAGAGEAQLMSSHPKYFKELLSSQRINSFVVSTTAMSSLKKDITKNKAISVAITINTATLRSDLEQNGVIRRFGL